ncbi:MAG TPA: carboxypeptidase-like regulatory domain-containing protein [Gemmatimonadaceae bacterium]|nr:carboxypeptidase-like regulatory domain-containing protein [Gemmatimonadaceae bacterium]
MDARIGLMACFVLLSSPARSEQSGELWGTVRDTSGDAFPGVVVEVTSPTLIEKTRSSVTDDDGRYKMTLPAGTYTATFYFDRYDSDRKVVVVYCATADNVLVMSGKRTEALDATLKFCREGKVVVIE